MTPSSTPLTALLTAQIRATGPLTVAEFMTLALQHPEHGYYRRQEAVGAAADFVTAPEISQVFGELIGLWLVQRWLDLGQPERFLLVELGPGKGTLMADALRAASALPGFLAAMDLVLIETNETLRAAQAEKLSAYAPRWLESVGALEADAPLLVIGNEFLDVLPAAQFAVAKGAWFERLVSLNEAGELSFVLAQPKTPVLPLLPKAEEGQFFEIMPSLPGFLKDLSMLLKAHSGSALFIDYAHDKAGSAWSLQAVQRHEKVEPLDAVGEADLTTLVDFEAAGTFAREAGLTAPPMVTQRDFLLVLGAWQRFEMLAESAPDDAAALLQSLQRLVGKDKMGHRFKAWTCHYPPTLPAPAGFPAAEGAER
ncbi:MAG: SAM-dependent methyltransferase [Geminicoccus sp.]|nr:SAM-dependent methyltransferase [Geminicoccus sp.]